MGKHVLHGIIPPMVTPFTEEGGLDERLHRDDARYMIDRAGVQGLAVCTSTGEGYTLSVDECRKVTQWTLREAGGKIPVIGGVIADSTRKAIERAKVLAELGVDALMVTPVHYVYHPDDDATVQFFADIAQAAGVPVLVDNVVPWYALSAPLLTRIVQNVKGVVGVKQGPSDLRALADLLMYLEQAGLRSRTVVFSAVNPLLYPSFVLGADGAISALTTASPDWSTALWNAVKQCDNEEALKLHGRLLQMWEAIDGENLPANVKAAMWLQKRKAGYPRAPIPISPPARRGKIRAVLGLR